VNPDTIRAAFAAAGFDDAAIRAVWVYRGMACCARKHDNPPLDHWTGYTIYPGPYPETGDIDAYGGVTFTLDIGEAIIVGFDMGHSWDIATRSPLTHRDYGVDRVRNHVEQMVDSLCLLLDEPSAPSPLERTEGSPC
jgi:hypothetical protein